MTIIKGALALVNYPFTTLPDDVLDLMHRSYAPIARDGMGQLTKLFDAYCDITNTTVTYVGMSSPAFGHTVRGFLGALSDETFIGISRGLRGSYALEFVRLLNEMAKVVPLLPTFEGKEGWPRNNAKHWAAAKQNLDPEAVRFWNGWPVYCADGKPQYLACAKLWLSHGPEFTEQVYKALCDWAIKMRRPRGSEFSAFLNFVSERAENWPVETFRDPIQIKRLFLDFMVSYFNDQVTQGNDIASATKAYAAFINLVTSTMLANGLWVKPFMGTLPKPKIINVAGADTNKKKNSKGEVIKTKLITEIPYEVTDTQAIDLLFKEIKADNDALFRWANAKAWEISNKRKARERLAKLGNPEKIIYATHSQPEELNPADVCAAFETHGLDYVRRDFSKRFGKNINREFLNSFLHVPSTDDLYPYKLLLVHAYPCITQSFIDNLELYNEKGDLHGFVKLEGYYQLTGYKDRKGGKLSEIKIKLKPRDAVRVRQVIKATQPLRDYLKEQGDDAWRYLFISCARGLTHPTKMTPTNWNSGTLITRYQHLADEFAPYLNRSREEVEAFICRISVNALRATRAVLIYIKSNSLTETAQALGHTVGVLMARRVSELLTLKANNCLSTCGQWLYFGNAKSTKHLFGLRRTEARPIEPIAADMIKNLVKMQKFLVRIGYIKSYKTLFALPHMRGQKLMVDTANAAYNRNLDIFCDYFEMPRNDMGQRWYLRQHQMRRFFAMLFFYCGSFSNLDTLRWMMGHTDIQHVWNYITESTDGAILSSAAAQHAAESIHIGNTENFKELVELIKEHYQTENYTLIATSDLEEYISDLLSEGMIEIGPIFFKDADGTHMKIVSRLKYKDAA